MLNIINNRFYYLLLSIIIFLSDQITKHLISLHKVSLQNKDLYFFKIDYVKNFGAAFNLFSGNRFFLSLISLIISIILVSLILNKNNLNKIDLLSYSFILGGTIGNGIDRINKGYVIDFININFIDFPVFNIADISINIGLLFIIYALIKYKR